MNDGLHSIGDVARASDLTVSALRFYDRAGVLSPVVVDPHTSYRWYSNEQVRSAALIAQLRRVGLALPEISTVLTHEHQSDVVEGILTEHVARLEQGLSQAKDAIDGIRREWSLINPGKDLIHIEVDATDLKEALNSVRFAIGGLDALPILQGIFMTTADGYLQISATDRYRAAFHSIRMLSNAPAGSPGRSPVFEVVLAASGLDNLLELLATTASITLSLEGGLSASTGSRVLACPTINGSFPDLRKSLKSSVGTRRIEVDRAWLREELQNKVEAGCDLVQLSFEDHLVLNPTTDGLQKDALAWSVAFLAQAISAGEGDRLDLEFSDSIAPLAIRNVEDPRSFTVLMPVLGSR
jgi:DNA polymerase-3 subunit beta